MADRQFVTESELARILGVGKKTVSRLRKAGVLPHVELSARGTARPLVRYDADAVRQYLARQTVGGDTLTPSTEAMPRRRGRPRRTGSLL